MNSDETGHHRQAGKDDWQQAEERRDVLRRVFQRLLVEGWTSNLAISLAILLMTPLLGKLLAGNRGATLGFIAGVLILFLAFINAVRRERESRGQKTEPDQKTKTAEADQREKQARLTAEFTRNRPIPSRHVSADAKLKMTIACTAAYDKGTVYLGLYDETDQEARSFFQELSQALLVANLAVHPLPDNPSVNFSQIVGLEVQVNPASSVARSRWLPAFLQALGEIGLKFNRKDTDLGPYSQAITIIVGKNSS